MLSKMFNAIVDSIGVPLSAGDYKKKRAEGARDMVPKIVEVGKEIERAIVSILVELGRPLTGV